VETQEKAAKLLDVVKSSPILQLEFKVFDNIEHKHITNEALAIKYIEDNVKLFEVYTIDEIEAEHDKLKSFVNESVQVDDKKTKLFEAVFTLVEESLMDNENIDVDKMHESFEYVLNHIKTNEPKPQKQVPENLNEEVIEIAINKFNDKYKNLSEDEVKLFKKLVEATDDEKKELFEEYKAENLQTLTSLSEANTSQKLEQSIEKINEMVFKPESADTDIVSLYELKKGLS
jgi:hypothetical protein